jgi:hypothetical protein
LFCRGGKPPKIKDEALTATSPLFGLPGICKVIQDGARSRDRTDDLFHEVEAVKAFPTDNDTELEKRDTCR